MDGRIEVTLCSLFASFFLFVSHLFTIFLPSLSVSPGLLHLDSLLCILFVPLRHTNTNIDTHTTSSHPAPLPSTNGDDDEDA